MATAEDIKDSLLKGLTDEQAEAVASNARQLLVVAGAGSGKTEVMARRIAWWIGVEGVPRDKIVAFTFTEKAAEEMKFRIRKWVGRIVPEGEDATLGRMFIGTIHGFCLQMLQELKPDTYGMFDVLDDTGRLALIQARFNGILELSRLQEYLPRPSSGRKVGHFETTRKFLYGYDLLHEFDLFLPEGPETPPPDVGRDESDWVRDWHLRTELGDDDLDGAFASSAARYYGVLRARRLLDFSSSQSELTRLLSGDTACTSELQNRYDHLVVDEVQDVNKVQNKLIRLIVGDKGALTAVGDHRQAIFGFRGSRVEIMGEWFSELNRKRDGKVVTLPHNFRATPRLIDLANTWARTIDPPGSMASPDMTPGAKDRTDDDASHVAFRRFVDRDAESDWIAKTIREMVRNTNDQVTSSQGVPHDTRGGESRGIGLSDIAVLVRSSKDTRLYVEALNKQKISAVVRSGPDLFQQPEVLLLVCALCIAAGVDKFLPGIPTNMDSIAKSVLNADSKPEPMLRAAGLMLKAEGLPVRQKDLDRLVEAAEAIGGRLAGNQVLKSRVKKLETADLRNWLLRGGDLRRIYPQTLFQWLAAEVGVARWDAQNSPRSVSAMYHLGQLAGLVTGIETPGWVRPGDFKWQMIALTNWGARSARSDEAPLLVPPDAVSVLTIHAAKGLEFPAVFLADVAAQRFPSQKARSAQALPFGGAAEAAIDPSSIADNNNYDQERRLMYVALTRAERFLFVSTGSAKRSRFERELRPIVAGVGALVDPTATPVFRNRIPTVVDAKRRLVTSFSDLRYYLECPHDYYLRKVLGFAPTIDQAFGYGRGVHNMMREVHLHPAHYAGLSDQPADLVAAVQKMIDDGLFYLRYTTGQPLDNMKARAKSVVAEYVQRYSDELATLEFEPERAFETLIEEADVLVSGAIDVIRHDDPPHVSLIDFKSGSPDHSDGAGNASGLDSEQMKLQVSLYGLAAKTELEYEPDLGVVRYLGVRAGAPDSDRELEVPLDPATLAAARATVAGTASAIQARRWNSGPTTAADPLVGVHTRCMRCDFLDLCGRPEASAARDSS